MSDHHPDLSPAFMCFPDGSLEPDLVYAGCSCSLEAEWRSQRQQSTPQGAGRAWRMKSGLETKLWLSFKRHIRHRIDLVVRI